jgi:hypothetical protein
MELSRYEMTEMSRYKYPMMYEVTPVVIDKGTSWLNLKLKNIGNETLRALDIQLHSQDAYYLTIYGGLWGFGAGQYLSELRPSKEKEVVFRVIALGSADVYATVKALKDGKHFWWESGWINIKLSEEKAEIGRLLVLSNPYTVIGKTISAEATIKGLQKSTGLKLEFWVETPRGKAEEQATIDIKDLPVGEEARYSAEFTPKETGYYTIYAYLYDGWQRIGTKTESIYARKQ